MNNTVIGIPASFTDLTTDIVMIDDYVTNREGCEVMEMVEKAGRSEQKPAWFFSSGNDLHNDSRECSHDEQIAQCYSMLPKGCSGLLHFCALPKYPRNRDALKNVNREFFALQDAIYSEEKCPENAPFRKISPCHDTQARKRDLRHRNPERPGRKMNYPATRNKANSSSQQPRT